MYFRDSDSCTTFANYTWYINPTQGLSSGTFSTAYGYPSAFTFPQDGYNYDIYYLRDGSSCGFAIIPLTVLSISDTLTFDGTPENALIYPELPFPTTNEFTFSAFVTADDVKGSIVSLCNAAGTYFTLSLTFGGYINDYCHTFYTRKITGDRNKFLLLLLLVFEHSMIRQTNPCGVCAKK